MNATQLRDRLLTVQFALRRTFGWTGLSGAILLVVAASIMLAIPAIEASVESHARTSANSPASSSACPRRRARVSSPTSSANHM